MTGPTVPQSFLAIIELSQLVADSLAYPAPMNLDTHVFREL